MRLYAATVALALLGLLAGPGMAHAADAFLESGIPASSREWLGADYEIAVRILTSGKLKLPRFSDPQGSAILSRITATENFSFHRNKSLPLRSRFEDYLKLQESTNTLAKAYFAASLKGERVNKEVSRLLAFLLLASVVGVDLMDEFVPTIPRDDKYAVRMDGLRQFRSGLTTQFVGAEMTLTEANGFSSDDRSAILEAMGATLPKLKGAFAADVRIELARKLEIDKTRLNRPKDIQLLDGMIRELRSLS